MEKPIPNFSFYTLTTDGKLFSLRKGIFLTGCTNNHGYLNFRIRSDDKGTRTVGLHRLLAFTYLGLDPNSKLEVNHLDGDKLNNDLKNLEITSRLENIEHAGKLGLTLKCRPVETLEVRTGQVLRFPSAKKCAQHLKISSDSVISRARIGECRIWPDGLSYRFASDKKWNVSLHDAVEALKYGVHRRITVFDLKTGSVKNYPTLSAFSNEIGASLSAVSIWLNSSQSKIGNNRYLVKDALDQSPWREDIPKSYQIKPSEGGRPIEMTDLITGEKTIFCNGKYCSATLQIPRSTLSYVIKNKRILGKRAFRFI